MVTETKRHIFGVGDEFRGKRLDTFLSAQCRELSRSQIQRLIREKKVWVNGQEAKASHLLKVNESVRMEIPPPKSLKILPENIPLHILFEDKDILVLNKEASLVVHPGAGVENGTIVNALLGYCTDLSGVGGKLRPGIVHRLDKGTSGVMVIAKNDYSHHMLSAQFETRKVEKEYLAFVWGCPDQVRGRISKPLGRDPKSRIKISSNATQTREAQTEYKVIRNWKVISLLMLRPLTGRTHQIRVHLTESGWPIIGDPTYGKGLRKLDSLPENIRQFVRQLPFQLLHASRIKFTHPRTEQEVIIEAPMRDEMREFMQLLEGVFE